MGVMDRSGSQASAYGRLRLFAASLWVSLATALLCALVPVEAANATGSAFNPTTSSVAIQSQASGARSTVKRVDEGGGDKLGGADMAAPDALPPCAFADIPVTVLTVEGVPPPPKAKPAPQPTPQGASYPRGPPRV